MSGLSKTRLAILVGAVIAAVGIVIAVVVMSGAKTDAPSGGTVKIELRGSQAAKVRMNGKSVGTTPTTVIVPRGAKPLAFEATFHVEKYGLKRPEKKVETWTVVKSVVPDADQLVDFNLKEATQTGQTIGPP